MHMASCALPREGLDRQRERYARLAAQAEAVVREPRRVSVVFAPGYDAELLAELVAVERECCPFFALEVGDGRLSVSVSSDEDARMLDAVAEALGTRVTP
jgi:hypothetical protein